jgi:DNA polymerase-3 subunit gamma/tau
MLYKAYNTTLEMSQALYRKYRPKKLDEVAGQDHVTKTLTTALNTNNISHAYLFTGPKGVGKTSVARILAHEVNGLEYSDDSSHIDIIEIDAASNRRIDEIRELRELVYMAPVQAKYKVYIIDEVHMLTKEAFNALLKTLEEPPAHVIFILATTDAHKLPETIISRTQRYSFKPISDQAIIDQIKKIAEKEKIKIDEEAIDLIVEHSDGSLRDSESLLDQARSHSEKEVTAKTITELLGLPPRDMIEDIANLLNTGGEINQLAKLLNELNDFGYASAAIAKELSTVLRQKFLDNKVSDQDGTLNLLEDLLNTQSSFDPKVHLELSLLRALPKNSGKVQQEEIEEIVEEKDEPVNEVPIEELPPVKEEKTPEKPTKTITLDASNWPDILTAIKGKHNTLYSIVRMAEPEFEKDKLILSFEFEFHIKRLNEANNQKMLREVIRQISGSEIEVIMKNNTNKPTKGAKKGDINKVSAIFNGAELLES